VTPVTSSDARPIAQTHQSLKDAIAFGLAACLAWNRKERATDN
jgi:hypothetical protein